MSEEDRLRRLRLEANLRFRRCKIQEEKPSSKNEDELTIARIQYMLLLRLLLNNPRLAKKLPPRFWALLEKAEAKIWMEN